MRGAESAEALLAGSVEERGRELPWRRARGPYAIRVSAEMLQSMCSHD